VAIASRLLPLPEASTPKILTELGLAAFGESDKTGKLTNLPTL
jgi:hypothetical protein